MKFQLPLLFSTIALVISVRFPGAAFTMVAMTPSGRDLRFRLSHPSLFLSLMSLSFAWLSASVLSSSIADAGRLADGRLKTDSFAGRCLPMDQLAPLSS